MHTKHDKEHVHWYREPLVWLVIAFPLTAVIAGFVTLGLAVTSDDGLVEDDYYRQGKEINRVLARDRVAAQLGLKGTVELDAARHELKVSLDAREDMNVPEQIELRFLHATRAGLDKDVILPRTSGATYRAPLPELAQGHWNVQLAAQDWRLVGSLRIPGDHGLDLLPSIP